MTDDMSEELRALVTWLEAEGYVSSGAEELQMPGDRHARWVDGDMQVRIGTERDDWFVDLSCRAWGGTWHDVRVVRAALADLVMGVTAAGTSALSGLIVDAGGFPVLALVTCLLPMAVAYAAAPLTPVADLPAA